MSTALEPEAICPICQMRGCSRFVYREAVPVHQHLLFDDPRAACAVRRGVLDLRVCGQCGFVFNASFDPSLLDYGAEYENSQDSSPAFNAYLEGLIGHLVSDRGVRSGRVVEVGCGKGRFLRKLLEHPDNDSVGIGFDTSYVGPMSELGGRLRFERAHYGADNALAADFVICRHVIEHVGDPLTLLRDVRAALDQSGSARVFFETPCVEWILRQQVPWDFFYEHCSLFTAHTLGLALSLAGFKVTEIRHVFGGQYLWAEAGIGSPDWPTENPATAILAEAYRKAETRHFRRWGEVLDQSAGMGGIVVWGAGAKGATFCNLADPAAQRVEAVVDVNPAKQGRFVCGAGHRIVAPEDATAGGISIALVLNPNYVKEVAEMLARLGSRAKAINLMELGDAICG